MIFYFTGTGNSLYAAARLAHATADRVVSIAECMQQETFSFPEPCERVGFVFPVYWYGLPVIVERFLDRLALGGCDYVYAVVTCGGSAGGTVDALRARLQARGTALSAAFSVRMPDNYILLFSPPKAEKRASLLAEADRRLDAVAAAVTEKRCAFDVVSGAVKPRSGLLHRYYESHRGVGKFRADDRCTGCGRCAALCPERTISLVSGRPVWQGECTRCLACLHRCPAGAIQYGRGTEKRERYVNPKVMF